MIKGVTWIDEVTINLFRDLVAQGQLYYQRDDSSLVKIVAIANKDWANDGEPEPCAIFDGKLGFSALLGEDPSPYLSLAPV